MTIRLTRPMPDHRIDVLWLSRPDLVSKIARDWPKIAQTLMQQIANVYDERENEIQRVAREVREEVEPMLDVPEHMVDDPKYAKVLARYAEATAPWV